MIIPVSNNNSDARKWQFTDGFGNAVLPSTVVIDAHIVSGGSVVSEVIEKGSFATYNKVMEPLEINVTLAFEEQMLICSRVLRKLKSLSRLYHGYP